MVRFRSMVFVTFMLALLSDLAAVQALDEHFESPPAGNDSCSCNITVPTTDMLKLCLEETNEAVLCQPCGMKNKAYLNCSECSVPHPPVCGDQRKWNGSHVDSPLRKGYLDFYIPPDKIVNRRRLRYNHIYLTFSRNSYSKMRNTSHSPFYFFKIDNDENYLDSLTDFERRREGEIDRIFFSYFTKNRKNPKMKIIPNVLGVFREKQKFDDILSKLCDAGLLSDKSKICKKNRFDVLNGINSTLSNLTYRHEAERTENDDLFGMTDKAAEIPEEGSTTRLPRRHDRKFLKEDAVTIETITRQESENKKYTTAVRGKKNRKFTHNKQENATRNPQAKFKSGHLEKGSHPNKALLDKQTTSVGSRFHEESGEINHQFYNLSQKRPQSTKHKVQVHFKLLVFSENIQGPLLKEMLKDTSDQVTNENVNDAEKKYIIPKFRTGRKLLQFSVTDNKKLVVNHDGILFSQLNRRSLKHLPENNKCSIPEDIYYGNLDCTVWSHQTVCVMTCNKDNNVQGSDQREYKCVHKKNVWEPTFQPCENSASRMDYIDLKSLHGNKETADSKELDKSRDVTLPTYEYITGDEEYDVYVYEFKDNQLA